MAENQRQHAEEVRTDWLGRPMFCQVCGKGMDSMNRWQKDDGKGLVYGHELCLWPGGFPRHSDGPISERTDAG